MSEDLMFRFPSRPPRRRTLLGTVLAPLRWLVAIAVIVILFVLWLAWGAALLFVYLVSFFLWGRIGYMLNRHLLRWRWIWERGGMADLRDWAFARRVTTK
jgi:hypothetical protein